MTDFFLPSISVVVDGIEKAYSNDPYDSGGETKWGVARNYHPEISPAAWAAFSRDDALKLYRAQYWDSNRCGEMPWAWALCVFDGEVNQPSIITLAQDALGVRKDGKIGAGTLAAMANAKPEHLARFMALRAKAYVSKAKFPYDGDGWFTRLFIITQAAAVPPASAA